MKLILQILMMVLLPAALARGQQEPIRIKFDQGQVTLIATEALLSDVLAEWAKVGGSDVTGVEHLAPTKITVTLEAVDEAKALESLIGSANSILVSQQEDVPAGSSRLVRVVIGPATSTVSAPTREVDKTIPESQFEYLPPVVLTIDDPDAIALRAQALGPQPLRKTDPLVMPEMLFDYGDPAAAAPTRTNTDVEETGKIQPETDR